jgi:hypothetical protein
MNLLNSKALTQEHSGCWATITFEHLQPGVRHFINLLKAILQPMFEDLSE